MKAEREIPTADYYEDYPQLENGVGMIRSFADESKMATDDVLEFVKDYGRVREVSVVTGAASYPFILGVCEKLCAMCPTLKVNVYKIINNFFGESITVSGLLTGKDISEQLESKPLGEELLIPENALRHGEDVFLCGMTVDELSERLHVPVRATGGDGYEFVEALLGRQI